MKTISKKLFFFLYVFLFALILGCGVKAPPLPPEEELQTEEADSKATSKNLK